MSLTRPRAVVLICPLDPGTCGFCVHGWTPLSPDVPNDYRSSLLLLHFDGPPLRHDRVLQHRNESQTDGDVGEHLIAAGLERMDEAVS